LIHIVGSPNPASATGYDDERITGQGTLPRHDLDLTQVI